MTSLYWKDKKGVLWLRKLEYYLILSPLMHLGDWAQERTTR